jgi:hypothetical protein
MDGIGKSSYERKQGRPIRRFGGGVIESSNPMIVAAPPNRENEKRNQKQKT